jgi:Protein of unknown function (DUF1580)
MPSMIANPEQATPADLAAEILAGAGLSMAEAAAKIPSFRAGRPTAPTTIARWAADGVRLPDGRTLRLESTRIGGRVVTTVPALIRFITAQEPGGNGKAVTPRPARGARVGK